jgi:hypothetical protein
MSRFGVKHFGEVHFSSKLLQLQEQEQHLLVDAMIRQMLNG